MAVSTRRVANPEGRGSRTPIAYRRAGPIRAYKKHITGITARGQRESVTTDMTGVSITSFNMLYLQPMWTRDSSAARQLFDRLNRQREDPFVELRLRVPFLSAAHTHPARASLLAETLLTGARGYDRAGLAAAVAAGLAAKHHAGLALDGCAGSQHDRSHVGRARRAKHPLQRRPPRLLHANGR